jgi:hypothetical protein
MKQDFWPHYTETFSSRILRDILWPKLLLSLSPAQILCLNIRIKSYVQFVEMAINWPFKYYSGFLKKRCWSLMLFKMLSSELSTVKGLTSESFRSQPFSLVGSLSRINSSSHVRLSFSTDSRTFYLRNRFSLKGYWRTPNKNWRVLVIEGNRVGKIL